MSHVRATAHLFPGPPGIKRRVDGWSALSYILNQSIYQTYHRLRKLQHIMTVLKHTTRPLNKSSGVECSDSWGEMKAPYEAFVHALVSVSIAFSLCLYHCISVYKALGATSR